MDKVCNVCKKSLPLNAFNKNKSRKDGLEYHCRACGIEKAKKYYKENKEKSLIKAKNYKAKDLEKYKAINNLYYARNKDYIKQKQKLEIDNLADTYISKSIKRYMKLSVVPQEMIEAKRNLLLIQRELRGKR